MVVREIILLGDDDKESVRLAVCKEGLEIRFGGEGGAITIIPSPEYLAASESDVPEVVPDKSMNLVRQINRLDRGKG